MNIVVFVKQNVNNLVLLGLCINTLMTFARLFVMGRRIIQLEEGHNSMSSAMKLSTEVLQDIHSKMGEISRDIGKLK